MPYLPKRTPLGRLKLLEVYEYYDMPRLFLCRNQYEQRYLALSAQEDEAAITWLYVRISLRQLEAIRSGEIELRNAFLNAEDGCVFKVMTHSHQSDTAVPLLSANICDEWLPYKGEKISLDSSEIVRPKRKKPKVITSVLPGMEDVAASRLDIIIQAYEKVRDLWSSDRVIADPVLNKKYTTCCRQLGLPGSAYEFNRELMNARKANKLAHLRKAKPFRLDPSLVDKFYFACELAIRFFKLTKGVTVDQILCDPHLAAEFDQFAAKLAPGFTSLDYRWTAFSVRKRGGLKRNLQDISNLPEPPDFSSADHIRNLRLSKIPDVAGFYMFSSDDDAIFLNQTNNLQVRLTKHMQNSGERGLPACLWEKPLQISVTPRPDMRLGERKIIELLEVTTRNPLYNFFAEVA
jgi:hypothetical protein